MDINARQNEVSSNLCSTCRNLDFDKIFTTIKIPAIGAEITTIGKTPPNLDKINCNLCRFFQQTRSNYIKNYTRHVRLFNRIVAPDWRSFEDEVQSSRRGFLSVLRKDSRLRYDEKIIEEITQPGLIGYLSNDEREDCDIRIIDASAVDYQSICNQIDHCSSQHALCTPNQAKPSGVQTVLGFTIPDLLIDCIQGEIVRANPGDQYMALSYVWGARRNQENNASHVFSLSTSPLTIRDAAQVVRNLGRRFLWVDRYCIDQKDDSTKWLMIQHMDMIYEQSEATIVALYGEDDDSGLPGVSTVPRIPQPRHQTGKGVLISSCPPIRTLIESSRWNTRAWTYQEARLSRRCLFFSEYQVYFVCNQDTWSEAVRFGPSRSHLTELLNSQSLDATLFGWNSSCAPGYFCDRLEYSKRNLSFERDILDGFRGVLQRSAFVTYWGVPITLPNSGIDPNVGLALGFLWMRRPRWSKSRHLRSAQRKQISRRPGFPTWSWTSLVAEIFQNNYWLQSKYGQYINGHTVNFPQNEARLQFWLSIQGVGMLRAEDVNTDNVKILAEDSPQLLVEGDFINLTYRCRGPQHRSYLLFGRWIYFSPDSSNEDQPYPGLSLDNDPEAEDQTLVLIQWHDSQKTGLKRLVLMVVEWIDDNTAERRGLLTAYRDEFRAAEIDQLPRIRKRFYLR